MFPDHEIIGISLSMNNRSRENHEFFRNISNDKNEEIKSKLVG